MPTLIYSTFFRIGQETLLEENLEADEVEIELAPIAVQLAYVQQVALYGECFFSNGPLFGNVKIKNC